MTINYLIFSDLIMIFFFILRYQSLPPQIPLFYSHLKGENQLADLWYIFFLPILINIFYFVNDYLKKNFFSDNYLVHKILTYLNLFLITSGLVLFLRIILLIT